MNERKVMQPPPSLINAVVDKRTWARLGIRLAAREIGISPTTLDKFERGGKVEFGTLAKLRAWLCYGGND